MVLSWNIQEKKYPLPYGEAHPDKKNFPNHKLVFQKPQDGEGIWATLVYTSDRFKQEEWNYAIKYSGDDQTYPVYVRAYLFPRAGFEPLATITETDPLFPDSESGSPVILVEQELRQAEDPEISSLYVSVLRVYESIPGPWVPFTRYDDNLGPIQGQRRSVVNTGQEASLETTIKTTYEGREGSSIISWEIQESFTGLNGDPDDPVYPINVSDNYDDLYGSIQTQTQIVVATGTEEASITYADGVVTKIWYEAYNEFLLKKYTQTFSVPGPLVYDLQFPYGGMIDFPRIIVKQAYGKGQYTPDAPGTACPVGAYTDAVLISQKIDSPNEAVDIVTSVYDTIPTASDQDEFGFSLSYANDDKDYPTLTWKFSIDLSTYAPANDLSACPIAGYTALQLTSQQMDGANDQNQIVTVTRQYRTLPGPLLYDLSFPYGGLTAFARIVTRQTVAHGTSSPTAPGTACPVAGYTSGVQISQKIEEDDSRNIDTVQTVYDIIPAVSNQIGYGYDITHPYGGLAAFPRLTWKFTIASSAYAAASPGAACPLTGYTSAVLISESVQGDVSQNQELVVTRVYDTIPVSTDQQGFGFSVSFLGSDKDFPSLTWKFIQPNSYTPANDLSACPIAGYTTLLLVEQATEGDNAQSQEIVVTRVYKTLPGPYLPANRYDNDLGAVAGRRREVANSGQVASLTATTQTRYETLQGSALVSWEIEESWTAGISPAFPIQVDDDYDNLRGPVQITSQITVKTGSEEGSLSEAGGVVTQITYKAFNEYLLRKITQTFDVPGPLTYSISFPYGELEGFPRIISKQTYAKGDYTPIVPGTACTIPGFTAAVLISQKVDTDNEAWDVVTQVYDTIPVADDQEGFGYSVAYSGDDNAYPVLTWKFQIEASTYASYAELSACPITGYTALLLVDQQTDGNQDQNQFITVTITYETIPGPPVASNKLVDTPVGLVSATETNTRVAYGTTVTGAFGRLSDAVDASSVTKATRKTVAINGEDYPLITTYDYDGQLNAVVTTTREVVPAGTTYTKVDGDLEMRDTPINQWETLRIITSVDPDDLLERTEYDTIDYTFPAILEACTATLVTYGLNDTEGIQLAPTLRAAVTTSTRIKVVTNFHIIEPTPEAVYQIAPNDLIFRGITFSVSFNNVLNDDFTLTVDGFLSDQYLGLDDSVTFGESFPNATDYIADIGEEKLIGFDLKYYRGGIWITRETSVVLL